MGLGATRGLSVRARPRFAGLCFAVLLLLLLAGCASAGLPTSPPTSSTKAWGRDLLPKPLGGVSFSEDPALFLAGWTGMIAGAIAGGWLAWLAMESNPDASNDEASLYLILGGALLGAIAGAILLSLPVKGIEEFFHWLLN